MVTRRPRALSSRPRLEAVSPLPRLDATPPVTKTCRTVLSGALAERATVLLRALAREVSRGHCARPPTGGIARSTGVHGNTPFSAPLRRRLHRPACRFGQTATAG